MDAEKATYPVVMMARWLGVARQGYYAWRRQGHGSRRSWRDQVTEWIQVLWDTSNHRHGARRIRADLAKKHHAQLSVWLVATLMRELGLQGIQPRTSTKTTIPDPDAATRPDVMRRQWDAPVATTCLVGDITYLTTGEGWLCLATVIDVTTRMVVGWQMADHLRACLVVDAVEMAHRAGHVAGNAIFHSDRGAQYTSAELARTATRLDVRLSCGRAGVCWNNSVAESFFSMLKNEMYHRESFPTRGKARLKVATHIETYHNRQRPHSTLEYRTPAEAKADHTWLATHDLDELPLAA